jgi:hypothetical protein
MRSHSYPSMLLAISGAILMAVGLYFIVLRPALLPEDLNYMHVSLTEIRAEIPGLVIWLPKVFWVLGGYIFSTGLLTLYISLTTFRADPRRPVALMALAGLSSIGGMVTVNFLIDSTFKWPLAGIAALWGVAVALSWVEDRGRERQSGRRRGAATSEM